jgi:hypothetical protein
MKRVRLIDKSVKPTMSILDAIADHALFARWFNRSDSWDAWLAFLAALFALPMTPQQLKLYRQCTGRDAPPQSVAAEVWLVIGRRGGKSFILALIAIYLAAFFDYRRFLAPGERGTILILAADRKQARTIFRYLRALLTEVPLLSRMVERETADAFDLNNRISIEVGTASFRSTRGYTLVAALCDEIAFWSVDDDAADPDREIIAALRPGMATIPNAMLLCASSPYARRGALWEAHRRYFGKAGPILVWQAATLTMNPTVPRRVIEEATERDPASAAAEYGAQFRTDVEQLLTREAVEACISHGVRERPRISGQRYYAFVDPSGGSADSMTLAIGHREGEGVIIDAVRERKPPFSPEAVVEEFAALLKSYGIVRIIGDRYAGEWAREPFRKFGIIYEPSAKPKSDLYRDLLPAINSKLLDLIDNDRLLNQLVGLERRTARGGRDSIDHAPGGHDDIANAVAGVTVGCLGGVRSNGYLSDPDLEPARADAIMSEWRAMKSFNPFSP